jgi:hypothetical protein
METYSDHKFKKNFAVLGSSGNQTQDPRLEMWLKQWSTYFANAKP